MVVNRLAVRIILLFAVAALLATAIAGWKWKPGTAEAGWTWDNGKQAWIYTS
jgi:hypothetical protein